jgi:hypothetical protein
MGQMPVAPAAAPTRSIERLAALLAIMTAQIDAAMHETDKPAATLVETAHAMTTATQTLAKSLMDFAGDPARVFQDLMMLHDEMHGRATKAATAIQFHDRLIQSLSHVSKSLTFIADFISTGAAKTPEDWKVLGDRIRGLMSMEYERSLYDSMSGVPQAATEMPKDSSGRVEFF